MTDQTNSPFPPYGEQPNPNPYVQGLTPPPAPAPAAPPAPPQQPPYAPANGIYAPPPAQAYQNPTPQAYNAPPAYHYNQYAPTQNYGAQLNQPALWAMISGIAGTLFLAAGIGFLGIIAAVILGHIGLNQTKNQPAKYTGKGFAITGLIIGYIILGFSILILGLGVLGAIASASYSGY